MCIKKQYMDQMSCIDFSKVWNDITNLLGCQNMFKHVNVKCMFAMFKLQAYNDSVDAAKTELIRIVHEIRP